MISLKEHIISIELTIKQTLAIIDEQGLIANVLFVTDRENVLKGTVTDGDIRRGLLKGVSIDDKVELVMRNEFQYLRQGNVNRRSINKFKEENIFFVPVVDEEGKIVDILNLHTYRMKLPVNAILMAGGKGQRLLPFTENTPKPLLKVGDKPIIEHNIDRLIAHGIDNLVLSINYLGEQLINYFGDGSNKGVTIDYVQESKPLGTIGSVKLIPEFKNDIILVMNSDLLTNIDFSEFYEQFMAQNADMAIAATSYHVDIPYAVLETDSKNQISALKEKPRFTYYSSAGIYIFKKELIAHIPDGEFFNVTDLIEYLLAIDKKVISFPLLGYWLDIGKHEDYKKAQEDIKHLKW